MTSDHESTNDNRRHFWRTQKVITHQHHAPIGTLNAYALPANNEENNLGWIDYVWTGLSPEDRLKAVRIYGRVQLELAFEHEVAADSADSPVAKAATERVRVLKDEYGIADLELSPQDKLRVSSRVVRELPLAIEAMIQAGADPSQVDRLRVALANHERSLERRLAQAAHSDLPA